MLETDSIKINPKEDIEYDSACRIACKYDKMYQKSWIFFGRSLFILETGNYKEYKSLRDFSKKYLSTGYPKCKEILSAYKYLVNKNKKYANGATFRNTKIPPYTTINKCKRARKKYSDNKQIEKLEKELFRDGLSNLQFTNKLKDIETALNSKSRNRKNSSKEVKYLKAFSLIKDGFIQHYGSEKAKIFILKVEKLEKLFFEIDEKINNHGKDSSHTAMEEKMIKHTTKV